MARGRLRRTRPLWRTAVDAGGFVLVLAVVMISLDRAGVLDVGTDGYRAVDGDSLRRGETVVRLYGIDAVELNQTCADSGGVAFACGRMALDSLKALVKAHVISCKMVDRDRYGRTVAVCRDGAFDLNAAQVRAGWAVAYRRHALNYASAEREAKAARRGIWAGTFEMPEDYRARHRSVAGDVMTD